MLPHDQFYTHSLCLKFQRACRKLQQLLSSGKAVSSQQVAALIKRRDRYAKQLLSLPAYALKPAAVAGFSLFLSAQVQGQTCSNFTNADSANPIHRLGLPRGLVQPTFVDIDGDGDLDCYESNANEDDGGGSRLKITFLRNTGSKKTPYFEMNAATGFGNTSSIYVPFNAESDRTKFVDIDGDGDYDCFVGNYERGGRALFYKNTGTTTRPKFENTPAENPLSGISGSYGLQFSFADLDGDGDYDLVTSDLYTTRLYINTGTRTSAKFQLTSRSYATTFSRVTLYDYDKDGLTDMLLGNAETNSSNVNYTRFYRNTGTAANPKFTLSQNGPSFPAGFVGLFTFADLNNDGSAEAFDIRGVYATTASVATISRVQDDDPDFATLQAHPISTSYQYRWRKAGKIIPGATGSSYITSTNGSYTVEITGTCGTGISLPFVVTGNAVNANRSSLSFTSSVSKADMVPVVKAYPNPFTQQFSLYLGDNTVNAIIRISDVQGRIISTTKANSSMMQLGSNLQKGIYFIQVIQNNAVTLTQKIVKE